MIQARITDLNYNEILMYLGHRGQKVTAEVDAQIRRSMELVRSVTEPRLVYSRLDVSEAQIASFPMEGVDIRKLLSPCREAVLMAVTLGVGVDRELMRLEVTDVAAALILDSCASVAVENVCDCFEEDLRQELLGEGLFLTSRFSPGYGDLPLDSQGRMCEALNTSRRIGLTVTENYLMVPRKSVTAVMGIADTPQSLRKKGCEACGLFLDCSYRKRGISCE